MVAVSTTSGRVFSADDGESILDAALRQNISLQYSCRTGRCSTCKAKQLAGSTVALREEPGLSAAEQAENWILTCARGATSDVLLDVEDLGEIPLFPPRVIPARIQSLERLSPDVVKVLLRLPPQSGFGYYPGQYVEVLDRAGLHRSYSIANAPVSDGRLELHIRAVPGGAMSAYWFDAAKVNDLLRLRGPNGTFFLREVGDRDIVFLATGTGIAPVKAMLEGVAASAAGPAPHSVSVFWGNRHADDIYWSSTSTGVVHDFIPVLSRASAEWEGERGHVQDAFLSARPVTSRTTVYACGSDAMIKDARNALIAAGLSPRQFHSDAFVPSGTP